jgi:hypothetical protein
MDNLQQIKEKNNPPQNTNNATQLNIYFVRDRTLCKGMFIIQKGFWFLFNGLQGFRILEEGAVHPQIKH